MQHGAFPLENKIVTLVGRIGPFVVFFLLNEVPSYEHLKAVAIVDRDDPRVFFRDDLRALQGLSRYGAVIKAFWPVVLWLAFKGYIAEGLYSIFFPKLLKLIILI